MGLTPEPACPTLRVPSDEGGGHEAAISLRGSVGSLKTRQRKSEVSGQAPARVLPSGVGPWSGSGFRTRACLGVSPSGWVEGSKLESLILAQNERWRRA